MSVSTLPVCEELAGVPADEHPTGLRAETLADGVLALLVLTVVQRVIGFGRAVLFCRWLEPDQLGLWDMAWGFLTMAAPLAVLSVPGTFGRYAEHFRRRGALRPFVVRTAGFCGMMAVVSVGLIILGRAPLADGLFGDVRFAPLMLAAAMALLATIVYNYLTGLFTALRHVRLVAVLDFFNSLLFAAIGVSLLAAGHNTAESVVLAWGGACLVCALAAMCWLRRLWTAAPTPAGPFTHAALWRKLAPFAAWILAIDLLTNLFALADRALIVHFAPGDALAALGQYHSARVVPMLLVSIAALLASTLLPHLSHDWEAGRREQVSQRLTMFVKLSTLTMTAAAVAILVVAPWLFRTAFGGKYTDGLAVVPWALVLCVWFGAAVIVQQYLWCAEKARYVCAAMVVGLTTNIALSVVLLPRLGLLGAVLATTAGNALALVLIVELSRRAGFRFDGAMIACLAAPLALAFGWPAALATLALLAAGAWRGRLLSPYERRRLTETAQSYLQRVQSMLGYDTQQPTA